MRNIDPYLAPPFREHPDYDAPDRDEIPVFIEPDGDTHACDCGEGAFLALYDRVEDRIRVVDTGGEPVAECPTCGLDLVPAIDREDF